MQVILVKPERFETAAEIADHLRSKHAVLMNLETTPK
ncbi:MAG: cell division protein SepF, partial [Bacteroidaceae bacterium]|nr:cell division protein SepF [Bacteroidaceae bacterium]